MLKRFIRAVLAYVLISGAVQLAGRYLSRRLAEGDEHSNEFRIAAITSGTTVRSRAQALHEGSCRVFWGGAKIDLREAQLDPSGADLRLDATMGGIEVRLPPGWRVEMDTSGTLLGGVDLRIPADNQLSDEAPLLRVQATARFGGIVVTSPQ